MDAARRLEILKIMGIQTWSLRVAPPGSGMENPVPALDELDDVLASVAEQELPPLPVSADPLPIFTPHEDATLIQPEINTVDHAVVQTEAIPDTSPPLPRTPENRDAQWNSLASEVAACTLCPLHTGRTQTVFGVGNRNADWLIIGEAPGEQEDLQGEPFVGRAGQLLNEMIKALGLEREQVYIANILKCRPPQNRDPSAEESAACENYLLRQIELVQPKIILAVGRVAAQNLLKTTTPIGSLRGKVHRYQQTPLVITYHPAYLLRAQLEKRKAWEDLKLALETFQNPP